MKKRNRAIAIILAIFLGSFGIHKFYLKRNIQGVFYLLFSWTFVPALLAIIDIINLIFMGDEEFNGKYNN